MSDRGDQETLPLATTMVQQAPLMATTGSLSGGAIMGREGRDGAGGLLLEPWHPLHSQDSSVSHIPTRDKPVSP